MKRYSCFTSLEPMTKAEGAIEGSKEEVLAWMREKYPKMSSEDPGCEGFIEANVFFYEGDIKEFWLPDGEGIYLAEILPEER